MAFLGTKRQIGRQIHSKKYFIFGCLHKMLLLFHRSCLSKLPELFGIRCIMNVLRCMPKIKYLLIGMAQSYYGIYRSMQKCSKIKPNPLIYKKLRQMIQQNYDAGFTLESRKLRAFCLIGYKNDTFEQAEKRLWDCIDANFIPMTMLYRDGKTEPSKEWKRFMRVWSRPAIIAAKIKQRRAK